MVETCPECGRDYKKRSVTEPADAGDGNRHINYVHGYDNPDSPVPMIDDFCRVIEET
jgi:hypothetical protein